MDKEDNTYHYSPSAEADMLLYGDFKIMAEELQTNMRHGQKCLIVSSVERWEGKTGLSSALGVNLNQFLLEVKEKNPAEKRTMHELWVTKK